jgi:predicted Zn-dependent protease
MYCQRCGKRNKPEAEKCRYCKAPLLVVRQDRAGEGGDLQSLLGIEEYVIDKISTVEKQAHRSSEDVDLLVQAIDFLERNVMVTRAGIHVLVRMLRERGLLAATEFHVRWRQRTLDNLGGLSRKERFLEAKPQILSAFGGKNRRRFEERVLNAEDHLFNLEAAPGASALEEAAGLDPANGPLHAFLGEMYLGLKDLAGARRHLDLALAGREPTAGALKSWGLLALLEGRSAEARKALGGLQRKTRGEDASTLSLLALAEALCGDWKACRKRAEQSLALEESAAALFLLALVHFREGRAAAAEGRLDQLLASTPDTVPALRLKARILLARGWWTKGREALERLRTADPSVDVEAEEALYRGLAAARRKEKALSSLDAQEVLDMWDPVTEEADVFLRQVDL